MAKLGCFSLILGRKKKVKDNEENAKSTEYNKALSTLQIRLEQPVKSFESDEVKSSTFGVSLPAGIEENSECNVKVIGRDDSPVGGEKTEVAYDGEDEQEESSSLKRDFSDFDLNIHDATNPVEDSPSREVEVREQFEEVSERDGDLMVESGHVSDPGINKADFWASPNLKRSCSNLEANDVIRKIVDQLPPSKSQSFEKLQELAERMREDVMPGSPRSVLSHGSADRVMLKKHSSSQVLPSRSRKLWWKLFLWSHRNLHSPWTSSKQRTSSASNPLLKPQGGYCSDTLEPNQALEFSKSPESFTGESFNKGDTNNENSLHSWAEFQTGVSGLWPQNQWLAFPMESSPFARVEEWVNHLDPSPLFHLDEDDENEEEEIVFPRSPENSTSQGRIPTSQGTRRSEISHLTEEMLHANSVIQSLNSSSTVALIAGIGLKAIPVISCFVSLRSVNLSNNLIVHIAPGCLPKGLHSLDLSRNKISTIEGLRELTRLRVLDLSYNRLSRIGHGLSNCQLIKELYLSGNKISDVEGLHRLLKLTVLDLSFNKITTTKALGQLVANYNSLQAINLIGNPIQNNMSEDQVRKAVCGLLPKLTYLNKQPVKPQRAREVLTDSVARAALGNSHSSRRRAGKRVSHGGTSAGTSHRSSASVAHKGRHRSKSRSRQVAAAVTSSSR